jgi:integrase
MRGKGDGGVYQRADGRWVGSVEAGWVAGKRKRRTVTAPTRAAAVVKLGRLRKSLEAGVLPTTITVGAWMKHWLDEVCAVTLKPRTVYGYRGYVSRWITPIIGATQLQKLQPEQVRAVYAAMRQQGQSDASIRQVHAILRRALVVAEREGRVMRNVAAVVQVSSKMGKPHGTLSTIDAVRVIQSATDPRTRARLVCALVLGLRQGEALGLRWSDVDLARGLLHVRQALSVVPGAGSSMTLPKTAASVRTIPLPSGVVAELAAWRAVSSSAWLFPAADGGHHRNPRADWAVWKRTLTAAGVPHVPLHGARGSAASMLLAMGVPERMIADILGHANARVTQEHYLHSDEGQRLAALEGLSARLELGSPGDDETPPAR